MAPNNKKITSQQIRDWVTSIVNEDIFTSRERLIALFAKDAPRAELEEEFREFFNGYCGLALELEEYEDSVLKDISGNHAFSHLKHRVSAVETRRKSSPLGREARRMGLSLQGDPVPEIKVTALSVDEFQRLMHTLGNWQIFVSRERLVKLMEAAEPVKILKLNFGSEILNANQGSPSGSRLQPTSFIPILYVS